MRFWEWACFGDGGASGNVLLAVWVWGAQDLGMAHWGYEEWVITVSLRTCSHCGERCATGDQVVSVYGEDECGFFMWSLYCPACRQVPAMHALLKATKIADVEAALGAQVQ